MTVCNGTNGASSGTVPTFDNTTVRNNSVSSIFNLTLFELHVPRGPASNPIRDSTRANSTTRGVVFIDAAWSRTTATGTPTTGRDDLPVRHVPARQQHDALRRVVRLELRLLRLEPELELLSIIANGNGGQVPTGYSTHIDNGAKIQAALYATNGIVITNNATTDGPILGSTVTISQNFTGDDFGTILTVPPGMPGNPEVYAQPNPPQRFSS